MGASQKPPKKIGWPGGRKVSVREKAKALVFQVLAGIDVEVASDIVVGRGKVFCVADWSSGALRAMGVDLADVSRKDVEYAYTRGKKDNLKNKLKKKSQAVQMAWSAIRNAKSSCQGKKSRLKWKDHPMVYEAVHARMPTKISPIEIRMRLVETHQLLQLGKGLEVRDSADLGCPGLFLTTSVESGRFLTFYDGPAILCSPREHAEHDDERRGWFIATGLSSANSAVFAGFKSSDLEITTKAPYVGLMSLTNSSKDSPNCERVNIWSPICVGERFLSETIMLMSKKAICASPDSPVELVWDYCVRF